MKYIVFCLMVLIATGCSDKVQEKIPEKSIPIKTTKVNFEELAVPVHISGVLQAEAEMKLSFKIGGIIQSLKVEEGMRVRKNQVLASLNLTEINATLAQATAAFQKAERDLKRVENLYADTVVTLEQLENVKTAMDVAVANLRMAEFNQKHAQILAPADGVILKKFGEENELIGPGTPVYIFSGQQQAWIVKGGMADQDRIRVAAGDKAEIEFNLYPDQKFEGEVISVSGALDPVSATYTVEVVLEENPGNLISGLIGKAEIIPNKKQKGCSLPANSLIEAQGLNASVFVVNENQRVQKTPIKIAAIMNDQVIVSSGLENGAVIATDGAAYLMDGSLIQIVNE
jgi:membrane fusion protein, multidrug efflux system